MEEMRLYEILQSPVRTGTGDLLVDSRNILMQIVSQRGVVFLRDQHVTPQQMKALMLRITEVAGCVGVRQSKFAAVPLY
jgi:alpha-ketoglutarate-dependent taurine dioxygenase